MTTHLNPEVARFLTIATMGLRPGERRVIPTSAGDCISLIVLCADAWRFTTVQYRIIGGIAYPSPGVEWRRRPGNNWQPLALHFGDGDHRAVLRPVASLGGADREVTAQARLITFCNQWLGRDLLPMVGGRCALDADVRFARSVS